MKTKFSEWVQQKWDQNSAQEFVSQISPLAKQAGFSIKMIGSVAKLGSSSHDLDLLLIPLHDDADVEIILNHYPNWELTGGPEFGESHAYVIHLPDGKIVDLHLPKDF